MLYAMFFVCWVLMAIVLEKLFADRTVRVIFWVVALIAGILAILNFFTPLNVLPIALR